MAIQDTNTSKNHAIPQNIMDVEFKIIGELTLRQFAYLFLFSMLAYLTFTNDIGVIKWPLTTFFAIFGLALAFVPIQDRGMDVWIVNFIKSIFKPTQMVWSKSPVLSPVFTYESVNILKQELITLAPTSSRRRLEEYLDYNAPKIAKDPLDIPEEEYINKVKMNFSQNKNPEPLSKISPISDISNSQPSIEDTNINKPDISLDNHKTNDNINGPITKDVDLSDNLNKALKPPIPTQKQLSKQLTSTKDSIKGQSLESKHKEIELKKASLDMSEPKLDSSTTIDLDVTPLTPDRHSGRIFTSFIPNQGELVLPIRGEKVLNTNLEEQIRIEKDVKEKTEKLQNLITKIRTTEKASSSPTNNPIKPVVNKFNQSEEDKQVPKINIEDEKITNLSINNNTQDITDYNLTTKSNTTSSENINSISALPVTSLNSTEKSNFNKPNIINGVLKDPNGNLMPNILILIKNENLNTIRAIKSNELGQFLLSSPLNNGKYYLEVGKNNTNGMKFDLISINATGDVLPFIVLQGK